MLPGHSPGLRYGERQTEAPSSLIFSVFPPSLPSPLPFCTPHSIPSPHTLSPNSHAKTGALPPCFRAVCVCVYAYVRMGVRMCVCRREWKCAEAEHSLHGNFELRRVPRAASRQECGLKVEDEEALEAAHYAYWHLALRPLQLHQHFTGLSLAETGKIEIRAPEHELSERVLFQDLKVKRAVRATNGHAQPLIVVGRVASPHNFR